MFLSLARVVLQPFFVFSPAEIQSKGAVGFIKLYVRKSRWYGIGNLIGRSSISTSSIDYAAALEFHTANKFLMWDGEDQKEAVGRNDRA